MSDHLLAKLDPPKRIRKRAEYEAFAFSILAGDVLVRNESHADPENHEYRVTIEDGVPTACTCPADEHADEACKHRVAIAIRESVIQAATEYQTLTDGGVSAKRATNSEEAEVPPPGCEHLSEDFPCWECVRTGNRELPE